MPATAQPTLRWIPATQYVDGSVLPRSRIIAHTLYCNIWEAPVATVPMPATEWDARNALPDGEHTCTARTLVCTGASENCESDDSDSVTFHFTVPRPRGANALHVDWHEGTLAMTPPHVPAIREWPLHETDAEAPLIVDDIAELMSTPAGRVEIRFHVDTADDRTGYLWYGLVARGPVFGAASRDTSVRGFGIWTWRTAVHAELWGPDTVPGAGTSSLLRSRYGLLEAGREHVATLSWGPKGLALFVDGVLRVHDHRRTHGLVGSPYPLSIGGHESDLRRNLRGAISVAFFDTEAEYDRCTVDIVGSVNDGSSVNNDLPRTLPLAPEC